MSAAVDQITILFSKGPLLTKTWEADGTITGHGRAKYHKVRSQPVNNIHELATVLGALRRKSTACVIRGRYIGDEAAAQMGDPEFREDGVLRKMAFFEDEPHFWVMFDLDKYKPLLADPVDDPEQAIDEWIRVHLPVEFHGKSYYWQLSSSAGHPSKQGTLRGHLWFWMSRRFTSDEMHAWVTMNDLQVAIDRAPMNTVQAHYVADPVMAEGVVDPVPVRAGLFQGSADVVDLQIDEAVLAQAVINRRPYLAPDADAEGWVDPREKKGLVGAFCRAFPIEEVLMAEWFQGDFTRVNERRYTWNMPGHPPEGCFISDDGHHFVSVHNTAPCDTHNRSLNAFDLVRVYNYGHLDDEVPEDERWTWTDSPTSRPSDIAMRAWARELPEVKLELIMGTPGNENPFGQEDPAEEPPATFATPATVPGDESVAAETGASAGSAESATPATVPGAAAAAPEKSNKPAAGDDYNGAMMVHNIKTKLRAMGMEDDETVAVIDGPVITRAWRGSFIVPGKGLHMLNIDGRLVRFADKTDWPPQVALAHGRMFDGEVFERAANRILTQAQGEAPAAANVVKLAKELHKTAWSAFINHVGQCRQVTSMIREIDPFATAASMQLAANDTVRVVGTMPLFKLKTVSLTGPQEREVLDAYREFFPFFDDLLQLILHARFASDRRRAFQWLHCLGGWGKSFLLDGILGRDGLGVVAPISVAEVELAFEGKPCGVSPDELIGAWVIWVDEFKSVKSEVKQLNTYIILAPKGLMRTTVPVFTKVFTSAEGVESLAGSEGVEKQFADRFNLWEADPAKGTVDDIEVFQRYGKHASLQVLQNYAARIFNAGIERFRAMGKDAAAKECEQWLIKFHERAGILNTHELLSDNLEEHAEEVRMLVVNWGRRQSGLQPLQGRSVDSLPPQLKGALGSCIAVVDGSRRAWTDDEGPGRIAVVRHMSTIVEAYINLFVSPSQRRTLWPKVGDIVRLVSQDGNPEKVQTGRGAPVVRYLTPRATGGAEAQYARGAVVTVVDGKTLAEHQNAFANVIEFPTK